MKENKLYRFRQWNEKFRYNGNVGKMSRYGNYSEREGSRSIRLTKKKKNEECETQEERGETSQWSNKLGVIGLISKA